MQVGKTRWHALQYRVLSPQWYMCARSYSTQAQAIDQHKKVPRNFWSLVLNQRAFLSRLQQELELKEPSDWYSVTRAQVEKRGGRPLFHYYESLGEMLQGVFPEYTWDISRFEPKRQTVPSGFWKSTRNLLRALEIAEPKLGVRQPEDWYTVTLSDLREVGFPSHIGKMQLIRLLGEKYPGYNWKGNMVINGRLAQQTRLEKAISMMFPNTEIIRNARKEAGLINPDTQDYLELDIYIPSLNLAFEYQDIHHYKSSWYAHEPLPQYQKRDSAKRELAQAKGITLILIPCWWDGKQESLIATVKKARNDLLQEIQVTADPIPEDMPEGFLDRYKKDHIEGIGEPMTATFLVETNIDPSQWWMFEKFDGVRAFWNPTKRVFYSRQGNILPIPERIVQQMPNDIFLDGELWFGRDNFQEAAKISLRVGEDGIDWQNFKYMVFDIPNHQGTYQERYNDLVKFFHGKLMNYHYVDIATKVECTGIEHLETFFQDVIDAGGEGVILRDPSAPCKPGRSAGYLKHKKFRDAEAKVVQRVGPNQWECELPNGVTFAAMPATNEFVKRWDPKPGDIVSFKHRGYLLGTKKPKLPTIYRVREDMQWEDVVKNWKEQKPSFGAQPLRRRVQEGVPINAPKGHWRSMQNRRNFLCELANKLGFDPFQSAKWENVTIAQVIENKGKGLLKLYDGSLQAALKDIFPELQFKFEERKPKNYWREISNCKSYLMNYAKSKGKDPMLAESWYSIVGNTVLAQELSRQRFVKYHGGLKKVIQAAFPDLQFAKWRTDAPSSTKWGDISVCREYFDQFARDKGLDASVAENWYSPEILGELRRQPGGYTIQELHGGIKKAIQLAFPEVTFSKWVKEGGRQ